MSKHAVQRKKPVWRVYWDGLGAQNSLSATAAAAAFTSHNLITASEVEDLDDDVVVKRIVGEISWYIGAVDEESALGTIWMNMGILVENEQYDSDTLTVNTAEDAQDGRWAWLRAYYGSGTTNSNEGGNAIQPLTDSGGILSTHVDIKVARKLRGGDEMRLKVAALANEQNWVLKYRINLRLLLEV